MRSSAWRDGLKVEVESLDSRKSNRAIAFQDEEPTKKVKPLYTADQRTVEFFGCRNDNKKILEHEMRLLDGFYVGAASIKGSQDTPLQDSKDKLEDALRAVGLLAGVGWFGWR
jgi:hypothetical protein